MKYRKLHPYKYKTTEPYIQRVGISLLAPTGNGYVMLSPRAELSIMSGYAWDGASGPAIDTDTIMRGSLVHDALYQLMREGHLSIDHRKRADKVLKDICIEDGMNRFRAWYVYYAVRLFGGFAARKSGDPLTGPE